MIDPDLGLIFLQIRLKNIILIKLFFATAQAENRPIGLLSPLLAQELACLGLRGHDALVKHFF
jgi:hypothetical protein